MACTYNEYISNIIKERGRFGCGDEYHERHHIIPKCMGGSNSKDNLIDLYAKEHYEAHKLLALENPNNYGLQYAWWNMCQIQGNQSQERYDVSAEDYEIIRKICSAISSELNIGKNHPMYGKHHTDETKEKMSKAHKGTMCGEINPMYGKHHSEEWKQRNSDMFKRWHKEHKHPMSRAVIYDGVEYECITYLANDIHRSRKAISEFLRGKRDMPNWLVGHTIQFKE